MYNFSLNCWTLTKITAKDVETFVSKGYIAAKEAQEITAKPQQAQ